MARPNDPRLAPVHLTPYEAVLFKVFWVLHRDRPFTYGGPLPISLRSFKDFMDLFEEDLLPDEVDLLCALDACYLSTLHRVREGAKNAAD